MDLVNKSKNILILGCSFGVPNYFGPPGVAAKDHTEFLLKKKGHIVHNCSLNGGSNLDSLDRAKKYLKRKKISHPAFRNRYVCNNDDTNLKIDLAIWFHTELYRDKVHNTETELAQYIYSKFSDFFKELGAKTAVIGGAGDVHDCFKDYITADFFIKSWRQQILKNTDIPTSNGIIKVLNSIDLPINDKINIIDNEMQLIDLVSNSRFFPDGCHPGTEPHYELVEQLSKTFNL